MNRTPSSVKPGRPGSGVYPNSPLGEKVPGLATGRDVDWQPLVDYRRNGVSETTIHGAIAWADYTLNDSALTLRLSRTSNSGADWTDSTMSQGGTLFSAPDIAMSAHGEATAVTWPELGSGGFEAWSHFSVNSGLDWSKKEGAKSV